MAVGHSTEVWFLTGSWWYCHTYAFPADQQTVRLRHCPPQIQSEAQHNLAQTQQTPPASKRQVGSVLNCVAANLAEPVTGDQLLAWVLDP